MTTLFLLLAALSAVPFSTLNEKHINYVAGKDLGKENTRNNISDANGTGNCSRESVEKTSANDSANWAKENCTAEKTNDLSESYEEVGNKSRENEGAKTANGELIAAKGKFDIDLSGAVVKASGDKSEENWHTLSKSKLLFILYHAALAVLLTFVCYLYRLQRNYANKFMVVITLNYKRRHSR